MPKRLWAMLQEPKAVTATMAFSWLLVLAIGIVTFIFPPNSIQSSLGVMTTVMAGFLILGAVMGFAGCLSGWWWVERSGIIASGIATAIYFSTLVILQAQSSGSSSRFTQMGFIILVVCFFITRWLRIRGAQVDPTRGREPVTTPTPPSPNHPDITPIVPPVPTTPIDPPSAIRGRDAP